VAEGLSVFLPEDGSRAGFRKVLLFKNFWTIDKVKKGDFVSESYTIFKALQCWILMII